MESRPIFIYFLSKSMNSNVTIFFGKSFHKLLSPEDVYGCRVPRNIFSMVYQ